MILHDLDNLVLPAIGRPDPLANALKTGTDADCPRVPEDADAVNDRAGQWYLSIKPQNMYHAWLVDQISVTSLRIDHVGRIERRLRDRAVLRAELFWDDDRRLEAIELGEQIAFAPAKVVNQLRRTPQGCDWMIDRWARLARIADVENKWDKTQKSLAFDLLGAGPDDRTGQPGETIDCEGRLVAVPDDLAALARREIASLFKRKAEVTPLDALDRTMARSDYVDQPSPEIRELRRQDATLHRRLKWYLAQINLKSVHSWTDPVVYKHFLRGACAIPKYVQQSETLGDSDGRTGPTPEDTPAPLAPTSLEVRPSPLPAEKADAENMTLPARRAEKLKKAEARRESRRRKLDRLRA
jgi:hypothetical protein